MDKLERAVREAYDSASMPIGLKEKTLTYLSKQNEPQRESPPSSLEARTLSEYQGQCEEAANDLLNQNHRAKESPRKLSKRHRKYPILALAACLILAVFGFGVFRAQVDETAFISVDINPSFELGLNRFNTVTSVNALNNDAQEVLENLPLVGMSFEDALTTLVSSESFKPYLAEDAFMDISVVCGDTKQAARLLTASQSYLSTLPCEGSSHISSRELCDEAHGKNMGVGKYQAALKLMEYDSTITFEDCHSLSMRELKDRIAQYEGSTGGGTEGGTSQSSSGTMQGQSQHQGQGMREDQEQHRGQHGSRGMSGVGE